MMRKVIAILLLGVFGAAMIPVETSLDKLQRSARLRQITLNLSLRNKIGQNGYIAALSGFRAPLAAYLYLEAYSAWQKLQWGKMAGLFDTITTLQPRSLMYWDMASWHMAWNASVWALDDVKGQPSEALRIRNQQQYIKMGKDILERGIENNPESYALQMALANLLQQKLEDHCGAGEAYLKASELPGAPPFAARFAGYELAKCPHHEREAYDLLKKLYDKGPDERKGSLITTLKELEKKLDVPPADRIPSADPSH
ncbi:hypothetical protein BH09VER1_BH09VER1_45290 [soil metagenome]